MTTISQLVEQLQQIQILRGDVPVDLKVYTSGFGLLSPRPSGRSMAVTYEPRTGRTCISALEGDDDDQDQ